MSKRYTRQELLGADLVWLFRLTYAGRVFRWSSRPISLLTEEGQQLQVDGGLDEVDFQESFSLLSYEPDPRSVSLELLFPVSVAELEALGHSLVDAGGELSLIRVGDAEEDRMALMKGLVRNPVWGGDDEPVSMTVQQPPWLDQGIFPPASQVVSLETWQSAPDWSLGKAYPFYFGNPGGGYDPTNSGVGAWGGQAYAAQDDTYSYYIICGNEIDLEAYRGANISPDINDFPPKLHNQVDTFNMEYVEDLLGQRVVCRKVALPDDVSDQEAFQIECCPSIPGRDQPRELGYGLTTSDFIPDSARVMRGAGAVAKYILSQGNVDIDHLRWETIRERTDQLKLDGAIMDFVDPGQWVVDNILPLLPISLVSGPDGVYPIWWDPDAPSVARIVAGVDVVRTSQVEAVRDATDCYTQVVLDYAPDYVSGRYSLRVSLSHDDTFGAIPNLYLARAATRRRLRTWTQTTNVIYETAQAEWVAAWKARALSEPVHAVTYEVGLDWGWLEPGMVVELTDADMRFDGLRCLVGTMDWGLNSIGITFTFGSR